MHNRQKLLDYNQCLSAMNAANPTVCNEYYLFHGTSADAVESINRRGLDRCFSGKHATAYGLVSKVVVVAFTKF